MTTRLCLSHWFLISIMYEGGDELWSTTVARFHDFGLRSGRISTWSPGLIQRRQFFLATAVTIVWHILCFTSFDF